MYLNRLRVGEQLESFLHRQHDSFIESFLDLSLLMIHGHTELLDESWFHCGKVRRS